MHFETRTKITSDGKRKPINLLIDAYSFTEAEAKTVQYCEGMADVMVEAVKIAKIHDIINLDGEFYYKVKAIVEGDKPERMTFLIRANDEAKASEIMHDSIDGFIIESITKTKIEAVI